MRDHQTMKNNQREALWERAHRGWLDKGETCRCAETCWCPYEFVCIRCGDAIRAIGEDMPEYVRTGGQCVSCFYFDDAGNPL
ncbi:MAG: hypothetical protein WKF30_16980 [Pyrinomonadaceae bacterium]